MAATFNLALLLLIQLFSFAYTDSLRIPFAYAFSKNHKKKYPIQLSFNHSQTYTPDGNPTLYLFNANIDLNSKKTPIGANSNKVIIGLKNPSDFLYAVSSTFGIPQDSIQFGKNDYQQLILDDISFVESQDIFENGKKYDFRVIYNYGKGVQINSRPVELIDGEQVFFNELVIREILNKMPDQNKISYKFDEKGHTISVSGQLDNFPRITLLRDGYLFELKLHSKKKLHYLPAVSKDAVISTKKKTNGTKQIEISASSEDPVTLVGVGALSDFGKFQIEGSTVVFKRTSLLYMLYLFLAYFFFFTLGMLIFCGKNSFQAMQFVRNIMKWTIFKDNNARIEVLRTELE